MNLGGAAATARSLRRAGLGTFPSMLAPSSPPALAERPALTDEQALIVASRSARLVVVAGAGTGKTSTLCEYARARPARRLLYVAFNKAIQLEAAARMPANVSCRTTHSLAFGVARDLFGAAAFGKVGNTCASAMARALDWSVLRIAWVPRRSRPRVPRSAHRRDRAR